MRDLVRGRSVALVGRAGYLTGSALGAEIDAADVVVRVNWRLPIPRPQVVDTGARTDLIYHGMCS